jgi:hypothetical protein
VRDRGDVGTEAKIRFTSAILPKWARRTRSVDALLPVLYLRGKRGIAPRIAVGVSDSDQGQDGRLNRERLLQHGVPPTASLSSIFAPQHPPTLSLDGTTPDQAYFNSLLLCSAA